MGKSRTSRDFKNLLFDMFTMRIKACVISWLKLQQTRFVEFGRLRPESVLDVYLDLIITCKLLDGKKFLEMRKQMEAGWS
ncbi:hypothetical protein AVEN_253235-1 [Araneus ventricosus]|uniref:Uncharacterized protein n=1 Tax=Araneus ventricosus TaxID=182803 RepID=A0A4Y2Q6F5_ARAVE|nr:hypothetical protein AVEN_253235-1 [Araneus ventricosus]